MSTDEPFDPEADIPTDAELATRFESLGDLVSEAEVPALVRAGVEVWSYGYDTNDPELFTTLDADDLWAFDGPDPDPSVVAAWAPFRVDPQHREHVGVTS